MLGMSYKTGDLVTSTAPRWEDIGDGLEVLTAPLGLVVGISRANSGHYSVSNHTHNLISVGSPVYYVLFANHVEGPLFHHEITPWPPQEPDRPMRPPQGP